MPTPSLPRNVIETRLAEARAFQARCESALNAARQTRGLGGLSTPDWKIEGLEEALTDATEAVADYERVLA